MTVLTAFGRVGRMGGVRPIVQVQKAQNAVSTGASISATFASTPVIGNRLIAIVYLDEASGLVPTPSGWTRVTEQTSGVGDSSATIFERKAGASEPTNVFVGISDVGRGIAIKIFEYSGLVTTTTANDKASSDQGTGASVSSGPTATTTVPHELVIAAGAFRNGGAFVSATNGFSDEGAVVSGVTSLQVVSKVVTSTGGFETTITQANSGGAVHAAGVIATFKGA